MKLYDATKAWSLFIKGTIGIDFDKLRRLFAEQQPEANEVLTLWTSKRFIYKPTWRKTPYQLGYEFECNGSHLDIVLFSIDEDGEMEPFDDATRNTREIVYPNDHVLIKPEQLVYVPFMAEHGLIDGNCIAAHPINFYTLHEYKLLV